MLVTINLEEYSLATRKLLAKETKDSNLLEILSKDEEYEVQMEVAKNQFKTKKTIENLMMSKWEPIRFYLAGLENMDLDFLDQLSRDSIWSIRYNVAKNPSTRKETKERLEAEDKCEDVRRIAQMSIRGEIV